MVLRRADIEEEEEEEEQAAVRRLGRGAAAQGRGEMGMLQGRSRQRLSGGQRRTGTWGRTRVRGAEQAGGEAGTGCWRAGAIAFRFRRLKGLSCL